MRSNDWVLIGAGAAFGVAIGAVTSSATANLFSDAGAKATIYMGIAGIAGVIATILANGYLSRMEMIVADKERRDDNAERKKAIAHAVIFKMMDIHTNLHHVSAHVSECMRRQGENGEPWQCVLPIANLPTAERFSTDELALVLGLGDGDLFMRVANAAKVYFSTIDAFEMYCKLRMDITSKLVPDTMDGAVGAAALTHEQFMKFRPHMVSLNMIIQPIVNSISNDVDCAKQALGELVAIINKKLGMKFTLVFD